MSTVRTFPPDLFEPPAPEQAKAASILDDMAEERRAWLDRMRAALVQVCEHRVMKWGEGHPCAYVCADDARRLMTRPGLTLPAGASPNLLGSLFRTPEWELIDREHVSSTPGGHGNLIARWRYVDRKTA